MTTTTAVTIDGILREDPAIRYQRNGTPVTTLIVGVLTPLSSVESAERSLDDHVVEISGDVAENAALSLATGMRVVATGKLAAVSTSDGYDVKIVADVVAVSLADCTVDVHPVRRVGASA